MSFASALGGLPSPLGGALLGMWPSSATIGLCRHEQRPGPCCAPSRGGCLQTHIYHSESTALATHREPTCPTSEEAMIAGRTHRSVRRMAFKTGSPASAPLGRSQTVTLALWARASSANPRETRAAQAMARCDRWPYTSALHSGGIASHRLLNWRASPASPACGMAPRSAAAASI